MVGGDCVGQHGDQRGVPDYLDERLNRVGFQADSRCDPVFGKICVDVTASGEIGGDQGQRLAFDGLAGQSSDGVGRAGDDDERFGEKSCGGDSLPVRLIEGDAEVEFVGQELAFHAVLTHFPNCHSDAGMVGVQFGDKWCNKVGRKGGGKGKPEMATREVGYVMDRPLSGGEFLQCPVSVFEVGLTGIGEAHRAAGAIEELRTDAALQLLNLLRQRRLGDMEVLGCAGEVPAIGDGLQVSQVAQFRLHDLTIDETYRSDQKSVLDTMALVRAWLMRSRRERKIQ